MEEILASIRRIIEDNDSAAAEPAARPSAAPAHPPAAEDPPVVETHHYGPTVEQAVPRPKVEAEPLDTVERFRAEFVAQVAQDVDSAGPAEKAAPFPPLPEAGEHGASMSREEPSGGEAGTPERQGIVSQNTGRKVAAAFGELNEAFENNRRKQISAMAEEMLRPMLQEWLDNNLPGIVERLVREEIERAARGG